MSLPCAELVVLVGNLAVDHAEIRGGVVSDKGKILYVLRNVQMPAPVKPMQAVAVVAVVPSLVVGKGP